jgi:outer membrane protease
MKNITALAVLVIIILCNAQAEENYSLSLSPRFGVFYGQAEEIVYPSRDKYPRKGQGDYLSQLLWDIKPVFFYGLDLDFAYQRPMSKRGFFSVLSLKAAIPGESGKMEDRDWQSIANNDLTNYSVHDNTTENIFWLDFSAGLSLPLRSSLLLKFQAALSYMNFGFYGRDGYGIYAAEDPINPGIYNPIDESAKFTFDGKIISYTQEWYVLSPGVSLRYDFLKYFYLETFFQISPLIFCRDTDDHLYPSKRIQYVDIMAGGLFLEPRINLSFSANKWIALSLEASYRCIILSRGVTYQRYMGSVDNFFKSEKQYTQAGEAGAGLSIFNAALIVKIGL